MYSAAATACKYSIKEYVAKIKGAVQRGGERETGENVDYEFTDKDLEIEALSTTDVADMMRYSMEDPNGCVIIRSMDGTGAITIHDKEEAVLFTNSLMDYFRRE